MTAPVIPYTFAKNHGILVTGHEGDQISILLRNNASATSVAEIRRSLGVSVSIAGYLDTTTFDTRLAEAYVHTGNETAEVIEDLGKDVDILQLMQALPPVEDILDSQNDAPVIRLVNALFAQALQQKTSDIHIEPYEGHSSVRFRHDGFLREIARPHRGLHAALASRIKIMASLDIAEKRLPQDGRIALRLGNRAIDVRVSTVPTTHGERLVMRLLEKNAERAHLQHLGMPPSIQERFTRALHHPHGIVLVTGPTGSGKTTTLYAALQSMDCKTRNIVTVEDPVEYDIAGVGQIQVNARIELTFAKALRSLLRQDPDVIMIGEIRDMETARIAVQASLTGHLVLATLHTNDSTSAITRLIDMGVERFLLASSLRAVLAQRLLRCLCPLCRQPETTTDSQRWTARGCPACGQSGYQGRTGIFEMVEMNDTLAQMIHDAAPEADLRHHAALAGTRTLHEDGLRLLADGTTSREELLRVISE
ncbi:MAG: type II secretion system ATPase GspE [Proteobacteria bacterium]|nr:type II secretion system ATPase GspE [Pseudomonadota bacterium]HQR02571.1 type II secretion system ATPase GspE [Rhodocyclaceae bacterium]